MSEFKNLAEPIRDYAEKQRKKQAKRDLELISNMLEIYDQKALAEILNEVSPGDWSRVSINKWINNKGQIRPLRDEEVVLLETILPSKPKHYEKPTFTFIDLFAGIGGIRAAFEEIGGECVFTSEWDKYAQKTYKANWYSSENHKFNSDITDVTLSNSEKYGVIEESEAIKNIQKEIPHEVDTLLAGFPCQPFSLAGVSKKNALGRSHGFECETQGTLFFDIELIIKAKRPKTFLLENVKNLKSHDKGKTFAIIKETLTNLGYIISDLNHTGPNDPKIIDAKNFVPQHRERIILVGFRKDLDAYEGFTLKDIKKYIPKSRASLSDILDKNVEPKYTLTPKLWEYLYEYAKKHAAKGNGFGYGLVDPNNKDAFARTLSARYHKDGSEILIDHKGWNPEIAEIDFWDETNQSNRPRRLTPRECARLMGFDTPGQSDWRIPVSDTQAYRQFGNSVAVPVFKAVARLLKPFILEAKDRFKIVKKQNHDHNLDLVIWEIGNYKVFLTDNRYSRMINIQNARNTSVTWGEFWESLTPESRSYCTFFLQNEAVPSVDDLLEEIETYILEDEEFPYIQAIEESYRALADAVHGIELFGTEDITEYGETIRLYEDLEADFIAASLREIGFNCC